MHFFRIEEQPAIDIAYEGVVREGVPEAGDDIVKFTCPPVALGVIRLFVAAEIPRSIRVGRGDDVPSGTTIAEVIERRKRRAT